MKRAIPLLALAIALAGCTAEPSEPEPIPADPVPEEPLPDLFGLVLDQDGERLAGATVSIEGTGDAVVTDVNGSWEFQLPPGDYRVTADRDGHRPASTNVAVIDRLAAHVVFTLPTWESLPPSIAVMEHRGFLSCAILAGPIGPDCPTESGSDDFDVHLDFTIDPIEDVIIELFWDPVTLSTETLYAAVAGPDGQWIAQTAGTSPLRIQLSGDAVDGLDRFRVEVTVDDADGAGFAVAQKYDAFTSVFLNDPAADDYSIAA